MCGLLRDDVASIGGVIAANATIRQFGASCTAPNFDPLCWTITRQVRVFLLDEM